MVIQNCIPDCDFVPFKVRHRAYVTGLTELRLLHIQMFDYLIPHIKLTINEVCIPGLVQIVPCK